MTGCVYIIRGFREFDRSRVFTGEMADILFGMDRKNSHWVSWLGGKTHKNGGTSLPSQSRKSDDTTIVRKERSPPLPTMVHQIDKTCDS